MKTDKSHIRSLPFIVISVLLLCVPGFAHAAWNISLDGDARYRFGQGQDHDAKLHLLGASVRKTWADGKGDRLTLFGLAEAKDNLSEVMLHEIYGQYKGPMGLWNITAGRFGLPWGLLQGFSASRLLYRMSHDDLLGMDADNGILVSGVSGAMDYGVSFTQGYGPHVTPDKSGHGLAVGRVGFTPGDTEELSFGISGTWGRSVTGGDEMGNHPNKAVRRSLGGLDAAVYLGRWLARIELGAGKVDHQTMTTGFAAVDYALFPRLDLTVAANLIRHGSALKEEWFVGFTGKPRWFLIRGGYRYAGQSAMRHEVTLQLYRMFSFNL